VAHLRAARRLLDGELDHRVRVVAASSVYETEPQAGAAGQRDFLNACLEIETELEPEALLGVCKAVERALGRQPDGRRHAPRPIDVDVLLLGDLEHRSERLTLPHPDILRRRFVLEPLAELDPELALPDGVRVAAELPRVRDQRARRLPGPCSSGGHGR
jgi:2-amino-4-hydroxy-6-hydroxymethyldihydropteridine diphosphokinase